MASEEASSNAVAEETAAATPSDETVAAALEEALQNARLLRVSSSIFLKEAKELLDSGRVSALLTNGNCITTVLAYEVASVVVDQRASRQAWNSPRHQKRHDFIDHIHGCTVPPRRLSVCHQLDYFFALGL